MSLIDMVKCDYPTCMSTCIVGVDHDFDGNISNITLPQGWKQITFDFDFSWVKHVCPLHTNRKDRAKARGLHG